MLINPFEYVKLQKRFEFMVQLRLPSTAEVIMRGTGLKSRNDIRAPMFFEPRSWIPDDSIEKKREYLLRVTQFI